MIEYASDAIFYRAHKVAWHPILIEVIFWLDMYVAMEKTATSTWRPKAIHPKDSLIHCQIPLRAIDLRSRGIVAPSKIRDMINKNWTYDPKRKRLRVCVYHDTGLGYHFHIQVHPNTVGPL